MKLYWSSRSPYVRKVMIFAHETGLADRIEKVRTVVALTQPNRDLMRINPLGKIPTLITDEGAVLFDSTFICEYLDSLHGKAPLFPKAGAERWRALRLQALADGVLEAAVLLRYENAVRPEALQWGEWKSGQFGKVRGGLDALEKECGNWGSRFSIGEITAACVLGYLDFRFPDEGWRKSRPVLEKWYAGISQRPSMKATVPQ